MAKFEKDCLKISLDTSGDEGSWFRLEPAFKFRTIGSRIAYGDAVRLASVKFEQYIHVSPKSLPFRNLYISGVYEINASGSASHFQLLAFCTRMESENVQGGYAIAIWHTEINAYLVFDPVNPAKGVFWRHKKRKPSGSRQGCNALWVIQADTAESGGEDVLAEKGVETLASENPKKKGYRLEHVCSGRYLAMAVGSVASQPGVSPLTMTDDFVGSHSLWHFRTKNDGGSEDDGDNCVIQFESDSPLYLQHGSSGWLTHVVPEKRYRISHHDFADSRDYLAGVRKNISMTDSMSLLQTDLKSMEEISRLMKVRTRMLSS